MAEKSEAPLPLLGGIGVGVMLLGIVAIVAGNPAALIVVVIGAVMLGVGLFQKYGRQRQRQHDELMTELRESRER
ncbi:hypothetical protein [Isoptericola aurantiacus]|uniref:hypothetical protein n=1 Tax=Isoptericola aurantiacus TaxID=3377839 RepID=UPI00383B7B72